MLRSTSPRNLFLGSLAAGLTLGCSYEPTSSELDYSLSEITLEALDQADTDGALYMGPGAVASHVGGALEMLFGTPDSPQFLLTGDWLDDEFNPNYGDLELGEDEWDALLEDNRQRRYKLQFQQLEKRNYTAVTKPKYADDLWARWQAFLPDLLENPDALVDESDPELGTLHDEALYMWESHYPSLAESAEMYRQQCLHCHGVEGGGDGPTSDFLEPRPRDYRKGIFKWVAVGTKQQPRRADLYKILYEGVNGTSMPSFARFSKGELHGLVDYIRLLAIRGQVETLVTLDAVDNGAVTPDSVLENYDFVWEKWLDAEANFVAFDGEVPQGTPEMVEHGRELFLGPIAACSTCHGEDGRGGGAAIYEVVDGETRIKPDEWGNPSNPRNFHQAILRGGSRPIDIYRRVKYGISGTIMPAAAAELTDDDLWSIVYYVRSMLEENDHARILERKAAMAAAHAAEHGHGDGHGHDGDHGHGDDHDHDGDDDGHHDGDHSHDDEHAKADEAH